MKKKIELFEPVKSGVHISEAESRNVKAVLNTPVFSVDEYGNISHCHCNRFITTECGNLTPATNKLIKIELFRFAICAIFHSM